LIVLTRAPKLKVLRKVSGHRVLCKEEPTNNEAFWNEYVPRREVTRKLFVLSTEYVSGCKDIIRYNTVH